MAENEKTLSAQFNEVIDRAVLSRDLQMLEDALAQGGSAQKAFDNALALADGRGAYLDAALAHGADINADFSQSGMPCLIWAVSTGAYDKVADLLARHADTCVLHQGRTALDVALTEAEKNLTPDLLALVDRLSAVTPVGIGGAKTVITTAVAPRPAMRETFTEGTTVTIAGKTGIFL